MEWFIAEKNGIKVGLVRPITIWPFPEADVRRAICQDSVKKAIVVEISAGQMVEDVKLAVNAEKPIEFLGRPGSLVPTTEEIFEKIIESRRA